MNGFVRLEKRRCGWCFLSVLFAWLVVVASMAGSGMIVIDPNYPHSFRREGGERFFPMGDTAYYLIAQPTNVIARYIDVRRAHRFNYVRMMAMAPGHWPFGGAPQKPDYTTINEAALQKLDWVFDYAGSRRMNIDLILWGYGVEGGEGLWAHPSAQKTWINALVNRYKTRENLFMYTVANEFERYPDGKYQFEAGDVEWAKMVASQIRKIDKSHAIGCHPSVWITDQSPPSEVSRSFDRYKDFTQRRPPVVWPLWDGSAIDLNVTQNNEGVQRRSWGDFKEGGRGLNYFLTQWQGLDYPVEWTDTGWKFEAAGLEACMAEDWQHGKPVLNSEFGYQFERGYEDGTDIKTRQVHQPSTVRKKAWKIATSGAYFAAGFESTSVRNFGEIDVDNFRPQHLETLYDFFTKKTAYWKMSPHLEWVSSGNVLLSSPGIEYVAYFPRGGSNPVTLIGGSYECEWLHTEDGECVRGTQIKAIAGPLSFSPPYDLRGDWVLHLWQIK